MNSNLITNPGNDSLERLQPALVEAGAWVLSLIFLTGMFWFASLVF